MILYGFPDLWWKIDQDAFQLENILIQEGTLAMLIYYMSPMLRRLFLQYQALMQLDLLRSYFVRYVIRKPGS